MGRHARKNLIVEINGNALYEFLLECNVTNDDHQDVYRNIAVHFLGNYFEYRGGISRYVWTNWKLNLVVRMTIDDFRRIGILAPWCLGKPSFLDRYVDRHCVRFDRHDGTLMYTMRSEPADESMMMELMKWHVDNSKNRLISSHNIAKFKTHLCSLCARYGFKHLIDDVKRYVDEVYGS